MLLQGNCKGYFGKNDWDDKRIEAIGYDWLVVRSENGNPLFASFSSQERMQELIALWLEDWKRQDE
jgi:hypothetical protein